MFIDYFKAERKHLFEYYDSITLIAIIKYEGQEYLIYAIEWANDFSKGEYMLAAVNDEDVEEFKTGAKAFLQAKFEKDELYHYSFSFTGEDDTPTYTIRLMTLEETLEAFPSEEFSVEPIYDNVCWVI